MVLRLPSPSRRHEKYENQFRSIFVQNCRVNQSEALRFPRAGAAGAGAKRGKRAKGGEATAPVDTDLMHPVSCTGCGTNVGVFDPAEDVYHFIDVMPSTS